MSKNKALRLIDIPTANKTEGIVTATEPVTSVIRVDTIPGPTNVTVSGQVIYRNTASPQILVTLTWTPAEFQRIDYFIVEVSESSTFASGNQKFVSYDNTASIPLKPSTNYYARVATAYENFVSEYSPTLSFTTIDDLTPPDEPDLIFEWNRGDLRIATTNANSNLVKDTRIRIQNPAGSITYVDRHFYGQYYFTADENIRLTGNNPLTTLRIIANHRSWSNIYSDDVIETTISPPPSGMSGLTTNWSGDTGTAAEDLLITWDATPGASAYKVELNNGARVFQTVDTSFSYLYKDNARNNPPSGLSTMPIKVYGINKISQSGVAQNITHSNVKPPTGSIQVIAGFTEIYGKVTHPLIQDLKTYVYTLSGQNTAPVSTIADTREITLTMPGTDNYILIARLVDEFGQQSDPIISGTFFGDALTLSGLRSNAVYSDSAGTPENTLYEELADDTYGSGIAYGATGSWDSWIRFERELTDRYRTITLSINPSSSTSSWYIRTSLDGNSWRYFAGSVTSGRILTEVANATAAQSAAVGTTTLGGGSSLVRGDLPEIVEARYIEVWFRNAAAGDTIIREFYPRRLVQSDDIEAESIRSINVAAGAIVADKINVINLRAVAINTGDLTISGILSISHLGDSGLYQGTGSFSSPTTGLKIWRDSSGIGRLTTYSGGVQQIDINTAGQLVAGSQGRVVIDKDGLNIHVTGNNSLGILSNAAKFTYSGAIFGYLRGYISTGSGRETSIETINTGTNNAAAFLLAQNGSHTSLVDARTNSIGITITSTQQVRVTSSVNVHLQTGLKVNPSNQTIVTTDTTYNPSRRFTIEDTSSVYQSFNNGTTERWVIGYESGNSRFTMYDSSTGGHVFTVPTIASAQNIATRANIEVGLLAAGTGNRFAHIDFIGDDTYTDFGLRLIRSNGGANTTSLIQHRGTAAFQIINVDSAQMDFATNNTVRMSIEASGSVVPGAAGTYNLGTAALYWNDVSYKTLTDRGCLGWFDEGVELSDGRIVSDTEALLLIEPEPEKKTVYGKPMLKYSSLPKVVYKEAPRAEEDIYEETIIEHADPKKNKAAKVEKRIKYKKGDKVGEDGAETTALISIMIGAIKELTQRVQELEGAKK